MTASPVPPRASSWAKGWSRRTTGEPEPLGPFGAKGAGEPALVPTVAAITGAIRHATGLRVQRLPVLPHRLKALLAT
jgi:CO/xanthine dehydrogenase Mo-binding subunit